VLSLESASLLAREAGLSLGEVERAALEAEVMPRRYLRNLGTLGWQGQLRLLDSGVAVFGLGGLGGMVLELLARMGVGRLVAVDGDRFSEDNLNRQLLSRSDNLGSAKAAAAAERVNAVNPAVELRALEAMADEESMQELAAGCAAAVDALDNIPSRLQLQEACRRLGIPMVHGAIAGFSGQVTTVFPGDPGLRLLYPQGGDRGIERVTGNPAATPALVAALEVAEVVKLLTGLGEPLRNRLLFLDTETNTFELTELD
jgi:molybdopterin/thiamine biosynthesis adenylyltransferase